jgi:sugar transferase (PEP-CTERM system associated)
MYYLFNRYLPLKSLLTWISESFIIFLTALLVVAIRFGFRESAVTAYDPIFIKTIAMTLTYTIVFYYFDLYRPDLYPPGRQMIMKLAQAITVATIALFSIYYLFPSLKTGRGILLGNTLVLPLALLIWRTIFSRWLKVDLPEKRILIIGSGELATKIGAEIYKRIEHGLRLVGFIDDNPDMMGQSIVNPGVIGGYGDIARIANSEGVDRIIVALPDRRSRLPMSALLGCKLRGITIEEGETFHERMTGKIPLDQLKPSWVVFSEGFKTLKSRKILKRIFDLVFSILLLICFVPIFLITALLIKLDSKGPVIFKQTRVGEHEREFKIYKFRSMRQDAETKTGPVWAETEDDRVTRVGKVIRKLRIDEIPQLINVVKGDMSFVGPRPERPYFVEKLKKVIPYYEIRTVIKPGVSGWAQIKYPYGSTYQDAQEKLQYDIYYIKNMSPLLDLMISLWTIKVILTGKGAR